MPADVPPAADQADLIDDPLLKSIPVHEGYKVLGGVVLYQKLGQGGMGAVYRGKHLRLNVDVAVKIMAMPVGMAPSDSEAFIRRFIREAQVAASINHQNLVRVIDVNTEADVYFLVMDYVDGESAGERLKRRGNLTEPEALEICLGAAEGLAEAHHRGIVHRDVKPDNIMVDKEGHVHVTDLGLAKAYTVEDAQQAPSLLTQTQTAMGTPAYMAPEQFLSARDAGPAADCWSLGVTLYQLLTNALPWTDSSVYILAGKVMNEEHPDPRAACAGASPGVCAIIERSLKKEPAERYPDCRQMGEDLRQALAAVRGLGESTLPDMAAGSSSRAMVAMTPPPPRTMTIIAGAALARASAVGLPRAGAEAPAGARAPEVRTQRTFMEGLGARRPWAILGAAVGVAVLLVVIVLALVLGGGDPLEDEAREFYRKQTEAAAAGKDAEVHRAMTEAGGKYNETRLGLKIKELADAVAGRIAEAEAEGFYRAQAEAAQAGLDEDVVRAVREAGGKHDGTRFGPRIRELARAASERIAARKKNAFDAAVAQAEKAERAENLRDVVAQLKAALEQKEDEALRSKLDALETRIAAVEKLLAEAASHEKANEWDAARAKYEEALKRSWGKERRRLKERLAEVDKRVAEEKKRLAEEKKRLAEAKRGLEEEKRRRELDEAVASARREADAGRWRESWNIVKKASADGLVPPGGSDPRLDGIARRAARALAPPRELTAPFGVELVLIPGGTFRMGSDAGGKTERPARDVTVSPFYIGRFEVTNAQHDEQRRSLPQGPPPGGGPAKMPAVSLSWEHAVVFCECLRMADPAKAVYRLPTEAEWEFAARGPSAGGGGREYPWGNEPPAPERANLAGATDGFAGPAPVGSFPGGSTPEGVADMAGNVYEWCLDWYGRYPAKAEADPRGPRTGKLRAIRGGAYEFDSSRARAAARGGRKPGNPGEFIGFRVVRELTAEEREFVQLAAGAGRSAE